MERGFDEDALNAALQEASRPEADTRPCSVGGNRVGRRASKCLACGSELGWRRFVASWNTTLALLIALVTAIGGSYRQVLELAVSKRSNISVHWVGFDQGLSTMNVLATNRGTDMGSIVAISACVEAQGGSTCLKSDGQFRIQSIPAGATIPLTATIDRDGSGTLAFSDLPAPAGKFDCYLNVSVINTDGLPSDVRAPMPNCGGYAYLIGARVAALGITHARRHNDNLGSSPVGPVATPRTPPVSAGP